MLEQLTNLFVRDHVKSQGLTSEEKVNDLGNWIDDDGITHIHVFDEGVEYQLINGEWYELPPF